MKKYTVNLEAAKNETWLHPITNRTVCIAEIADKMTDELAEMFYKAGCKAIEKVEDSTMATTDENTEVKNKKKNPS